MARIRGASPSALASAAVASPPRPRSNPPLAAMAGIRRCARHSRHSRAARSEEHTSELQSLMRISYAVFCLKKKNQRNTKHERNRDKSIPKHKLQQTNKSNEI